jgi:predicted secreted hydrolase
MINDKYLKRIFAAIIFTVSALGITGASARDNNQWQLALEPRTWSFPRDHGAHPEYRTEWWYFTGNLNDAAGNTYGYQLTFFRHGLQTQAGSSVNVWSIRDVYSAHFTMTDVSTGQFIVDECMSRSGPGLAGALTGHMDIWLFNWKALMNGSSILLKAENSTMYLNLTLNPRKPLTFHGNRGLSRKGAGKGQASYYTSFANLATRGSIRINSSTPEITVQGTSWFDHEFGSAQLARDQEGWDWFGLHLSDGRDLMIYLLRKTDKAINPESSGTLVEPDGTAEHLQLSDISVAVQEQWKSPKSGGRYPSTWRIVIPAKQLDMLVKPLVADQELDTRQSTGIIYWEGAVAGQGTSGGRAVQCEGYVELTGYAGSLGGIF